MGIPRFLPQRGSALPSLTEEEQRRLLMEQSGRSAATAAADEPRPVYAPPEVEPSPTAARVLEEQRTGPVYSPPHIIGNESALVKKQPTTLADYYTSHATPVDELTRPRETQPPEPEPSGPTVVYGDKGQPRGVEGGENDYERNRAYLGSLQKYRPEDHNGRMKSALLGFARGLQGVRGQSLLGGLIDPAADESFANEREIGRVGRAVETEEASRKQASDLQNEATEREYKRAQAQKALNPSYAPHYEPTEDGLVSVTDNLARPVYDPEGKRVKSTPKPGAVKTEVRHDPVTGRAEKWELGQNGQPDKKVAGWTDSAKDLVKVNGRWVPQSTAVTAEALGGYRSRTEQRDTKRDERSEQWRNEDKTQQQQQTLQQRREKAGTLTGTLDGARTRWIAADAKVSEFKQRIATETDPDRRQELQDQSSGWEFERSKAQREASQAATELKNSFGDIFEAGDGERGLAYYKRKPFNVQLWRKKYPKASKQQEESAIQNATDMGMEIER